MQQSNQPQRLLLHDVEWQDYRRFIRLFGQRRTCRLTYDRGTLEILDHERKVADESAAEIMGCLVVALTEELALPRIASGRTSLYRRSKRRGLAPSKCFWIASAPRRIGRRSLDLRIDPPPDLVLEVVGARSRLNRQCILAALGVPEVWRLEGQALTFHVLSPDNKRYVEATHSRSFSCVTPADLGRFLALAATHDDNAIVLELRAWVRQQIATPGSGSV